MENIKSLILENRSYRCFRPNFPIMEDELTEMVDCARLCPSGGNKQPLKYKIVQEESEKALVLANIHLAALLPDRHSPPQGHEPAAYIVVACDKSVAEPSAAQFDAGIATQSILLCAASLGYGGCIIGNFNREALAAGFGFDDSIVPMLVLALGVPDETVLITNLPANGSTAYFRDDRNVHFVPKRQLSDILL